MTRFERQDPAIPMVSNQITCNPMAGHRHHLWRCRESLVWLRYLNHLSRGSVTSANPLILNTTNFTNESPVLTSVRLLATNFTSKTPLLLFSELISKTPELDQRYRKQEMVASVLRCDPSDQMLSVSLGVWIPACLHHLELSIFK